MQGRERWTIDAKPTDVTLLPENDVLDDGDELAVGSSVARNLGPDVLAYLRTAHLPVRRFVHLQIQTLGPQAMSSTSVALGWAIVVRDRIADEVRSAGSRKLRLFLATPLGAALFLGHRWNRIGAATQLYEDVNPGCEPTFFVP